MAGLKSQKLTRFSRSAIIIRRTVVDDQQHQAARQQQSTRQKSQTQCATAKGGSETKQNNRFCFGFSSLDFGQLATTTTEWWWAFRAEAAATVDTNKPSLPKKSKATHHRKTECSATTLTDWDEQKVLSFIREETLHQVLLWHTKTFRHGTQRNS